MTNRMYGAFIACLGAAALMLAANETFAAGSGAGPRGAFASTHSASRPLAAHALRHHRRNNGGSFWPGDFYDGSSDGGPVVEAAPPVSGDTHYTYTYDVPWDWAHRYPPAVAPSDRPYVPGCPAETVTVPGRGGKDQTINILRCY